MIHLFLTWFLCTRFIYFHTVVLDPWLVFLWLILVNESFILTWLLYTFYLFWRDSFTHDSSVLICDSLTWLIYFHVIPLRKIHLFSHNRRMTHFFTTDSFKWIIYFDMIPVHMIHLFLHGFLTHDSFVFTTDSFKWIVNFHVNPLHFIYLILLVILSWCFYVINLFSHIFFTHYLFISNMCLIYFNKYL